MAEMPTCACCGEAARNLIRVVERGVYELLTWDAAKEAHDIARLTRAEMLGVLTSDHGWSYDEAQRGLDLLDAKASE